MEPLYLHCAFMILYGHPAWYYYMGTIDCIWTLVELVLYIMLIWPVVYTGRMGGDLNVPGLQWSLRACFALHVYIYRTRTETRNSR